MRPVAAVLLILPSVSLQAAPAVPDVEVRVRALLAEMTLEEKIGQMSQRHLGQPAAEIEAQVAAGKVGSFLNAGTWQDRNRLQEIARKKSRLGIPLLFGRDVIHGYRTILPIPLALASSFDPALVEKGAAMAAAEASADGHHWTFAPMIDITRDPRWGRIAETCGEDPYLTSVLGVAMVRGFQGEKLGTPGRIAACAKHYVGYGAAEAGRDYNSVQISQRELRDVYLPPFHAAANAGVATFMSAFHDLNGIPASANAMTLEQVLRQEWGYDGFVVSDWDSVVELIKHRVAADEKDAAFLAANNGVDMEMVSASYEKHLVALVREGKVNEKTIDRRVGNILRIKLRLGLFDAVPNDGSRLEILASEAHKAIAREAAVASAVLLKNEGGLLPLAAAGSVAVVGPLADSPVDQMGMWSLDGVAGDVVTPLAALRSALGASRVRYAKGLATSRDTSRSGFAAALQAARGADVVLAFVGEEMILSGEAHSRAFLDLPGAQTALVDALAATGKPLVLVVMAGRPLTFQREADHARAILWAWHNGTMGGPAIADLLLGKENPSGKLPVTFPRTVGQVPIYYAHRNTGRPASDKALGIPLGTPLDPKEFTSRHLDVEVSPAYAFGYGLSYTTFGYSNLRLSASEVRRDGSLTVTADVTNTGKREGTEIVQLYVRDKIASVAPPMRLLEGFTRVKLAPGEKRSVSFTLEAKELGFHGLDDTYRVEPGEMLVWVASDSGSGIEGSFQIVE
jgi:beta-glucosidase